MLVLIRSAVQQLPVQNAQVESRGGGEGETMFTRGKPRVFFKTREVTESL